MGSGEITSTRPSLMCGSSIHTLPAANPTPPPACTRSTKRQRGEPVTKESPNWAWFLLTWCFYHRRNGTSCNNSLQESGHNDCRQEETRLWPNPGVAEILVEFCPPQSLNHVPQRYKIKERLHRPWECSPHCGAEEKSDLLAVISELYHMVTLISVHLNCFPFVLSKTATFLLLAIASHHGIFEDFFLLKAVILKGKKVKHAKPNN